MKKIKILVLLHVMLVIYSAGGICSKLASKEEFLSIKFCFLYSLVIISLALYAIGWQQVIKRLPLTTAFANKAITVVWGLVWGVIVFGEKITIGKVVGSLLVICGIVVFAISDKEDTEDE